MVGSVETAQCRQRDIGAGRAVTDRTSPVADDPLDLEFPAIRKVASDRGDIRRSPVDVENEHAPRGVDVEPTKRGIQVGIVFEVRSNDRRMVVGIKHE